MRAVPGVILFLGLLFCVTGEADAQADYRLIPDSTYTYTFNTAGNTWDFAGASYSFYISGQLDSTISADNNLIPIAKSIYTYNNGVISETSSLVAANGNMVQSQHEIFYYNDNSQLAERIVTKWITGSWRNLNWFFYQYDDNGLLIVYDRDYWTSNGWTDFSADSLFYDEESRLVKRSSWSIPNGNYTTRTLYLYNDYGQRIHQIRQDYLNNVWVNIRKINYQYNPCGTQTGTLAEKWTDGAWQYESKTVVFYHYTMEDDRKKVPVCHNGQTIFVLGRALSIHLDHGDCLGSCAGIIPVVDTKSGNAGLNSKSAPFIVYPNPATEFIHIKMPENECPVTRVELLDYYGKVIRAINNGDEGVITMDMNNLKSGNYILRVTSDTVYSTVLTKK